MQCSHRHIAVHFGRLLDGHCGCTFSTRELFATYPLALGGYGYLSHSSPDRNGMQKTLEASFRRLGLSAGLTMVIDLLHPAFVSLQSTELSPPSASGVWRPRLRKFRIPFFFYRFPQIFSVVVRPAQVKAGELQRSQFTRAKTWI